MIATRYPPKGLPGAFLPLYPYFPVISTIFFAFSIVQINRSLYILFTWLIRGLLLLEQLRECPHALSEHDMKRLLLTTVADAPRPGVPPTYTAEQQCAIIGLAVRKPEELGLPIETWTNRELAELRDRILRFVDYFNRTMARAFNWTYRGRALQA